MTMKAQPLPTAVDGVFIGSGHNALVAANYLSRAGASVLLLESQSRVGGGLSTEEVSLPLFRHNLHVYFVRWTPNYKIWTDLRPDRYGLETIVPEVQNAIPLQDSGHLLSFNSVERSIDAIRTFSPRDADTYERLHAEFSELVAKIINPLRFAPPLPPDELESLLSKSALGRRYLELARQPALDLVLDLFEHEVVRTLVLFNCAVRGYLPVLDAPGTGYVAVLALPGSHTGAMIKGGTHQAARALAAGVYDNGGAIATNAKVARILVEGGRATGVELTDGRRVRAREFVCSNLAPTLTLGEMVDAQHVDDDLLEAMRDYRWNEEALFGVHLALREPPRYDDTPADAPVNRSLNYCIGYESSEDLIRDMRWIQEGTVPTAPAIHAGVPTVFDPGQAPPGYATAFAWQFVPTRPTDGGPERWDGSAAEAFTDLIVEMWRAYAPNLREAEIARVVHTPRDTQRYVPSMVLGDRHHGSYHPDNFDGNRPHPSLSDYRTPIERLYHCGSSTYPGGSFTGQPGYNAATIIARDLGYDTWWNPRDPRNVLNKL